MNHQWLIHRTDTTQRDKIVSELNLSPITASVLVNRGIVSPDAVQKFFNPSLCDIPDPFLIPDMTAATERIARAITKQEKIAIFGDYDVDGITATALLTRFFMALGINTLAALPDRQTEGYGLTENKVEELAANGARLIITVDNGTRATKAALAAARLGIDIVVTDHHDANGELPQVTALVNPERPGPPSHHKGLSGCGVAFMLALALRKSLRNLRILPAPEPNLREHLDLVALGTIADVMPLTGINRILVRHGIDEIANSSKAGINALINISRTNILALTPDSIAFQLAPRINAAGRLGSANAALELMLTDDLDQAFKIASELDRANRERQKIEEGIIDEALSQIEHGDKSGEKAGFVLSSKGWHVGCIGIAAAKIARRFNRPSAIISLDSNPARGSARSIEGINLIDVLNSCGDLLVRFGGHAAAAGFTVEKERLPDFQGRFDEICQRLIPPGQTQSLAVDAKVNLGDITDGLVEELARLQPFGTGNPEPVLVIDRIDIASRRTVGENHLRLRVRNKNLCCDAIGFRMADKINSGAKQVALAFMPEFNTWNGVKSVQLKLHDIKYV